MCNSADLKACLVTLKRYYRFICFGRKTVSSHFSPKLIIARNTDAFFFRPFLKSCRFTLSPNQQRTNEFQWQFFADNSSVGIAKSVSPLRGNSKVICGNWLLHITSQSRKIALNSCSSEVF
ncbi:hypothetical protein X975_24623, partial [Stegodyphus mimosarum]